MMQTRRRILALGGGGLAALAAPRVLRARSLELVEMRGTGRGERVWFSPLALAVAPGTTIRFVNRDPGNSHTATAYHPDLFGRQRRIPDAARPWHSDFLLPDDGFEVTLQSPGVYDYYCVPHEMAAMVGRIVVGTPADAGWTGPAGPSDDLPAGVFAAFPAVEAILLAGRILPEDRG
jgi:plastocyanin